MVEAAKNRKFNGCIPRLCQSMSLEENLKICSSLSSNVRCWQIPGELEYENCREFEDSDIELKDLETKGIY